MLQYGHWCQAFLVSFIYSSVHVFIYSFVDSSVDCKAGCGCVRGRWVQQVAGLDFLAAPVAGAPPPTVAAADGHVLAGLVDYRSGKRAQKALEGLLAAQQATAAAAAAPAAK